MIKPNPIDFDKVLVEFKSLQETGNVAVIVTISVVLLSFIIVQVIVRKADKKIATNVSNDDDTLLPFYTWCSEGHGFDSCRGLPVGEFFFVPHSCHVDHFTFHILLPSLKFTFLSSYVSQSHGLCLLYTVHFCLHYVTSLRRESDVTEPRKEHDWERTR